MTQSIDAELRRYVLRQLPDTESDTLEAAYFSDADLRARLEDVEDDVIGEYLAGTLAPADRAAFERAAAASPARRARITFLRGLRVHASGNGAAAAPSATGWPPMWRGLAAAALVVVAIGGWWLLAWRAAAPQAPTQAAAPQTRPTMPPPQAPEAPPAAPGPLVALALSGSATRGAGATPTAEVPANAIAVVLRLSEPLPAAATLRADVRAVDEDRTCRGEVRTPAADAPADTTAEVVVPTGQLPPGDYILTVRAAADAQADAVYRASFRVVRR